MICGQFWLSWGPAKDQPPHIQAYNCRLWYRSNKYKQRYQRRQLAVYFCSEIARPSSGWIDQQSRHARQTSARRWSTTADTRSMPLSTNIDWNPIPALYFRFHCHRLWINVLGMAKKKNQSINGRMNSLLDLVGKGQMYYSEAKNAPTRHKIVFHWGWHGLPVRKRNCL